jgi:hypothetical protein
VGNGWGFLRVQVRVPYSKPVVNPYPRGLPIPKGDTCHFCLICTHVAMNFGERDVLIHNF